MAHTPRTASAVAVALTGFMLAGATSHLGAQSRPVLSLSQAVGEALVKNDRLISQHDALTQSDLGLRLARNEFRPKLTPNMLGSFGRTDLNSQNYRLDLSQRFTTGTEARVSVGTATSQIPGDTGQDVLFYNADTTLSVTQPLLRGFGRSASRRGLTSAEVRRADADRSQTMAEQQVAIDVAAAYYRVVAQQTFVAVARQSLDRARKLRDASEAKLDAGMVSQLDVLRAQQLVSQSETQLFDAQSGIEDARDQLLQLVGRDAGDPFDVQTQIPAIDQQVIDTDRATQLALQNRLDLQGRAAERTDADQQLRFARNQLLPQVDVNFNLTRRLTADSFAKSFGLDGFQFATFFTVAMPVDRTTQQVAFQTAMLDRDRREREVATLQRQIASDVRRAVREHERLLRAMLAADTSIEIGRREVEVAQFRYERGLSNNLDVVSAESNLLAAESRRIQALADAAIARLRLRAMLGIFNPRTDLSGSAPAIPVEIGSAQ